MMDNIVGKPQTGAERYLVRRLDEDPEYRQAYEEARERVDRRVGTVEQERRPRSEMGAPSLATECSTFAKKLTDWNRWFKDHNYDPEAMLSKEAALILGTLAERLAGSAGQ